MINYRQNKQEILMLYTPNEIVDLYLKQCIVSDKQKEEIERLNNIIEEVRETLINSKEYKMAKELDLTSKMSILIKLLEILDKAGVDKEC